MKDQRLQVYLFFSALSISLAASFMAPVLADTSRRIGGWAWNPAIGWIRQRDAIVDKNSNQAKGTYGIAKDEDGNITGWSWSPKVGWICWGRTCEELPWSQSLSDGRFTYGNPAPPKGALPAPLLFARVNADKTVEGWMKILSRGDSGWISLSSRTGGGNVQYGVRYDEEKSEFAGWAWNSARRGTVGWIAFSGKTLFEDSACGDSCAASYDEKTQASKWKTQYIGPWLRTTGGNIASREGFEAVSPPPGDVPPELYKNAEFLILTGEDATGASPKAGEIKNFVSLCEAALKNTKACDNFGLGNPLQRVRSGALSFTKTKKIEVNLERGSDAELTKRKKLQSKSTSIDVDALTTGSVTDSTKFTKTKNRFGKKVLQLPPAGITDDFTSSPEGKLYEYLNNDKMGGTVFIVNGDLVIGDTATPWMIANGSFDNAGKPIAGGRTVVVKGNLIIKRPILYASTIGVRSLSQLGSVAWIVLEKDAPGASLRPLERPALLSGNQWDAGGNIVIDNCVPPSDFQKGTAELAGLFFAQGTLATGTGDASGCREVFRQFADIRIKNTAVDIPLVIRGALIAKKYALQRIYGGFNFGSENILNDGRMLVSVPPGLEDFLKSFPSF